MTKLIDPVRTCKSCRRALPIERFYRSGTGGAYRRHTCIPCVLREGKRQRASSGPVKRHRRYNIRGDVWCNACRRYLPAEDFRRHPLRPHTFWSYCKPCTRAKDRERYAKRTATIEGAELELAKKARRKHRLARRRDRERRFFVQESIELLRRRGLTKAEIYRLADTSFGSLLDWERGERRVTAAVEARFGVLIRETADLSAGPEPLRVHGGRRRPHPAIGELMARCRPQVEAIPVRSSWKNGRRA